MAFRLRPSVLASTFAILFAIVAILAWATALTTTGPWFSAAVGLSVYSMALLVPSLLAIVVVLQATSRIAHLDASLHRLDRRIALLRTPRASGPRAAPAPKEVDLDFALDGLADGGTPLIVRLEKQGHDTLVPVPSETRPADSAARTQILRQLVRERIAIHEARAGVWATAAGPVLMDVVFLAIAGPMLPGADGFAAAHYMLNTTLILFLSYGFAPLVAWSLIALGQMGSPGRRASA